MAKKKTSLLQKKSSPKFLEVHDIFTDNLRDSIAIKKILVDALMQDDIETFQDVLLAHLRTVSKTKLASKTGLGRQTLYDLISEDREFNPTLSTLAAILKAIAA